MLDLGRLVLSQEDRFSAAIRRCMDRRIVFHGLEEEYRSLHSFPVSLKKDGSGLPADAFLTGPGLAIVFKFPTPTLPPNRPKVIERFDRLPKHPPLTSGARSPLPTPKKAKKGSKDGRAATPSSTVVPARSFRAAIPISTVRSRPLTLHSDAWHSIRASNDSLLWASWFTVCELAKLGEFPFPVNDWEDMFPLQVSSQLGSAGCAEGNVLLTSMCARADRVVYNRGPTLVLPVLSSEKPSGTTSPRVPLQLFQCETRSEEGAAARMSLCFALPLLEGGHLVESGDDPAQPFSWLKPPQVDAGSIDSELPLLGLQYSWSRAALVVSRLINAAASLGSKANSKSSWRYLRQTKVTCLHYGYDCMLREAGQLPDELEYRHFKEFTPAWWQAALGPPSGLSGAKTSARGLSSGGSSSTMGGEEEGQAAKRQRIEEKSKPPTPSNASVASGGSAPESPRVYCSDLCRVLLRPILTCAGLSAASSELVDLYVEAAQVGEAVREGELLNSPSVPAEQVLILQRYLNNAIAKVCLA